MGIDHSRHILPMEIPIFTAALRLYHCYAQQMKLGQLAFELSIIPGAARLGRRPTGVAHSKITRVRVLSWPLPVLTSLYFLTVTKSCYTKFPTKCDESLVFVVAEVVSNQFKAITKIFLSLKGVFRKH